MQIIASYGLTDKVQSIIQGDGSTSSSNSLFSASSGASPTGIGSINTAKQLSYRPGQGALCRITALFSAGTANSLQAAGFINSEDGFLPFLGGVSAG